MTSVECDPDVNVKRDESESSCKNFNTWDLATCRHTPKEGTHIRPRVDD